jgi:diphthine-ammonia ligase
MPQVFTSWSGGKDSCFACYKAISNGLRVRYLLSMITEDGQRSWTHGLSPKWLQLQAQALGIPLVQKQSSMATYEADFKNAILALQKDGITGGVFGNIDVEEQRDWHERICREANITSNLPLWGLSQEKILTDFIGSGFEAIIVVTKADLLSDEWLGRKIDLDFIRDLGELGRTKGITLCGEAGEYHTFVINGPLFNQRLEILVTKKVLKDGYWFLDILECELRPTGKRFS